MTYFDKIVERRGTYCTQWDFVKDRFGKDKLLPFSISDMDFSSSPEIINALTKRVQHGIFGYTRWNHDDYKNAVVLWYNTRFRTEINPEWISYAPGVVYAVVKFLQLLNPDKFPVCLITPCYDGFIKILKANNYPINSIHQTITGNSGYQLNWDEFEKKLSLSKVFLLCNPNNPNGFLWKEEELDRIVEICKKHNVIILSDDIHMDFVYRPSCLKPILISSKKFDYQNQTIILTSHTKTFNLSGLGGAYVICPDNNIRAQYQDLLSNAESLGSASTLHITGLITGYNECAYWIDEIQTYLLENFTFAVKYLADHLPALKTFVPEATYFLWINCSELDLSMDQIQYRLINKGKVAIMDGVRYQEDIPFLRMNIACPKSKLKEGLQKICLGLKE
ncbi:MAG: MalY/PatB family protein [Brevinemataceae bacterium]